MVVPRSVLFPVVWVTNRCNLRCKMCDQWKTDPALFSHELSLEDWLAFTDSACRMHAAAIVLTGGEPLLRLDIFEIIRYIRDKGMACHLCSNGTLLDGGKVAQLKESRLNSISVSLDSDDPAVHNQMRGRDCFDAAIRGVKLLRSRAPRVKVGINCVITKLNFRGIRRMAAFAKGLGIGQVKFDIIHTNLMHRHKPLESFDGLLFEESDMEDLRCELGELARAASRERILTNSGDFMDGMPDIKKSAREYHCYAGYVSCAVDALGRVAPCDNLDTSESLKQASLEKIWDSPGFRELRRQVSGCSQGCWDTTHAELNIRCRGANFIKQPLRTLREAMFYLG